MVVSLCAFQAPATHLPRQDKGVPPQDATGSDTFEDLATELTTRQSKLVIVEMVHGALFPAEFFFLLLL